MKKYKARFLYAGEVKEIECSAWSKLNLRDHLAAEYKVKKSSITIINPAKEAFDGLQEEYST